MVGGALGYSALAASAFRIDVIFGLGLFSAMTAYDTH